MTIFTTMIEIPVIVEYTTYKSEGDGWDSPRIPAHIEVENISVQKDIEKWIEAEHGDNILQECHDHADAELEAAQCRADDIREDERRQEGKR